MRLPALILAFASSAFSQVAIDGITASASRTATLAPDEASVAVLVTTPLGVARQQVTEALQSSGFGGALLVAMVAAQADYPYQPEDPPLVSYQFALTLAATDLKDIGEKLEKFRAAKPEAIRNVRYQAFLRASDTVIEEARQRLLGQLLADARKRATSLANTAGLKLGAIQAVSDSSYAPSSVSNPWFSTSGYVLTGGSGDAGGPQVTFSLSVKFAVN